MAVLPEYQINGNDIPSPTDGKWLDSEDKGFNGVGQKQYTRFFAYEINWNELTQSEFGQLYRTWLGGFNSGTYSVRLPEFGNVTSYQFVNYTGTTIDRPVHGRPYKENYVSDVKIIIRKISI